jgi:hypothetical protein
MPEIDVIESFLQPEHCSSLVGAYESAGAQSQHHDHYGNALVHWSNDLLPGRARSIFLRSVLRAWQRTSRNFPQHRVYPEAALLALLREGQQHARHADREKLVDGMWVPNHTPHRCAASIVYLNDVRQGGELFFERNGTQPITPKTGLYVGFPASREFVHGVHAVQSNARYSLAIWFTDDRKFTNHALVSSIKSDVATPSTHDAS